MNNENESDPQIPAPEKSSGFFRVLKRLFLIIFILLLLFISAGFIIGFYYQDNVKEYVIGELNKQLNTKIIVDAKDIDFTVIKNFPYASLDFKNVKALEVTGNENKDTLFKAGTISFQFNIIDIFKKNYHIKKLALADVDIKIRIDRSGKDNYHFWKSSEDTSSTGFSFALKKIVLSRVHFSFKNYKYKQNIDLLINESRLSGEFSNEKYSLASVSDLLVNQIKIDSISYLNNKNVHAQIDLAVDNSISAYKIKEAKIKIEDLLFDVVGNIINANNESIMNLGIQGKEMNIRSVLSLIPNEYKNKIKDYESEGELYFDATIRGTYANGREPEIKADFGMKNADITQVKDNVVLHHVNLKGRYFNRDEGYSNKPSTLIINPFSATIDQGSVVGEISLYNLNNPSFDGKIKANISLEELQKFINIDTIETISGQLKMDATFSGSGKNKSSGTYDNVNTSGDLLINDMNMKLKNNPLAFTSINGDFKFDNNDLAINSLTGNVSSSDFELKGFFRNITGFILKDDQDIAVEATLNSKNIDLNELLANKDEDNHSKSKYKLKFSEHVDANLNCEVQHLVFRKFDATNIKGIIKLKDKKLIGDPITLSTMDGTITTGGMIDGTDSTKLVITCFSDVNKINITRMFQEFENFGETAITDKNIKGIATAKIQFASVLSPELQMDPDKVYAGVDMTIENGELNNVESMKSLSRFIELKDLESIRFSTLKNQIEIKNQIINIPKMEVKSSAINIIASGTHKFNNEINYKIKLSLNELLSKKAKQAKKENDEFGEVADDGLGRTNIFLSMTGTVDKPVIKYDSKSAVQNVKQDLKVEKQSLKTILKEEFGMFKKDSTVNAKTPKENNSKFIIKWDESDKKDGKKELKKPKKDDDDDF